MTSTDQELQDKRAYKINMMLEDLEAHKGSMSPEEYNRIKEQIEQAN